MRNFVFALWLSGALLAAQEDVVRAAKWRTEEVGVGVLWMRCHFESLFGSKQHVNVLVVDTRAEPRPRLRIGAAKGRQRTSQLGTKSSAIAALNGGYFDTKNADPVGVLEIDGKLLHDDSAPRSVAIAVAKDGVPTILDKPHEQQAKVEDALAAGPPLLADGKPTPHTGWEGMAKVRHPRTAIGLTNDGKLVGLVVDGRTAESAGMTCTELATTMAALGCTRALNLDGGGSSTLWVRGESDGGIVSCPCDNKTFDHQGERAVANALLGEAADVVVGDDGEATLEPAARFVRAQDDACILGEFRTATPGQGASASWQLDGMLPGKYRAFACWPREPGTVLAELGEQKLRFVPKTKPGEWFALGEVDLTKVQALRLRLAADGEGTFVVDAVRLVQIR